MVVKQLQIIFHIDLLPNISALRVKTDGGMSVGMSEGVGSAEANVRQSNVNRIILPDFAETLESWDRQISSSRVFMCYQLSNRAGCHDAS
jgi:hypothetical protein